MKRESTFTVTYNYFEPGTYVVPTSMRCVLAHKSGSLLFKVTKCYEPLYAGDACIVFVEGHEDGVETESLREATQAECVNGDRLEPIP